MAQSSVSLDAQHQHLGDDLLRDLASPDARSAGFRGRAGYARVAPAAVQSGDRRRWIVGFSPTVSEIGVGAASELLMDCLAHVADHGGGDVTLWRQDVRPDDDRAARNAGLEPDRDLYEMEISLPPSGGADPEFPDGGADPKFPDGGADPEFPDGGADPKFPDGGADPKFPDGVRLRTFAPGIDDTRWLALNNAAFAGHAEQGNWTLATLAARRAEPWFDSTWFLIAERDGDLIGFNWLRRHPASRDPARGAHPGRRHPERGEIYVIGVAPSEHGTGLGRALAIAGFNHIAAAGVTVGLLYVAAENEVALGLYRALGFEVTRTDRAYTATVVPA